MTITLLTDFGTENGYAAALHGAIRSAGFGGNVEVLSHDIPAFDLITGSLALLRAVPYWPTDTIHLAVVDPGVGSDRRWLAIRFEFGTVVAPDNGILHHLLHRYEPTEIHTLITASDGSPVFEARDLLAQAVVRLSEGSMEKWQPAENPVVLSLPEAKLESFTATGYVIDVDHYGTLVTNIDLSALHCSQEDGARQKVFVGNRLAGRILKTFSEVDHGEPVAFWGSTGFLEIACREGRADSYFSAERGSQIEMVSAVSLAAPQNETDSAHKDDDPGDEA